MKAALANESAGKTLPFERLWPISYIYQRLSVDLAESRKTCEF